MRHKYPTMMYRPHGMSPCARTALGVAAVVVAVAIVANAKDVYKWIRLMAMSW